VNIPLKAKPVVLHLVLAAVVIGALQAGLAVLWPERRWMNHQLHSAMEALGGLAAIVMALVLLQRRQEPGGDTFSRLALGFLGMGVLEEFHAVAPLGNVTVLVRSVASLVGGIGFALVWLPESRWSRWTRMPWAITSGCLAFGLWTLAFPDRLPQMIQAGEYTATAIALKSLACVLFIAGAVGFLRDFHRSGKSEDYCFASMALMFGAAELIFTSAIWDSGWWFWHVMRWLTYVLVLGYIGHGYLQMIQELRRREAYLAEAQRLSHTGSFGWRISTGEIVWSEETSRIFQYDRTTKPTVELVFQRIHPEDAARVKQTIERASQNGKDYEHEYRLVMPDSSVKYVHSVAHAVSDESGTLEFVGTVMDVTVVNQAEAALREQASLLNLTHDTVFVRDMKDIITYWNRGAEELYGWTREEAVGKVSHQLTQTIFPAPLEEINAELLRTGRWDGELHHTKRDGTQVIVASRWSLQRDKQGLPAATLETNNDITERKRTEATLEHAFQEIQVLKDQLYKENLALKEEIDRSSMFEEIVGASPALQAVLARAAKVAPTDSGVLITGETGTGKELIARAIHKRSPRAARAFVNVNCAAVPPSLIASELFGHEKGAFTGALQRHLGRFELAEGGTIFLDEIGELPAETQIALLRVLQEHEFERVGGTHTIRAEVRVIAATNRDLKAAIAAGAFRSDLFYRLNVFPIEMPPLRDRQEDIPVLVEYFIDRYASKAGKKIRSVNKKTLELLQSYPWPGNIRELQNVIERSVIVCDTENFSVDESWLSRESLPTEPASQPLSQELATHEKDMIEAALVATGGRVSGPSGAAAKLGLPPSTLESKIRSLKINKHHFKTS
jgi:PAS domain S-box-containing protein